nr:MAG TPA: hypothetical protein [Caudoviricetes sp.]
MATEETTITELELAEEVLADMVIPVDTSTDTKSVSLKQLRAWLGSSLPTGFILPAVGKINDERFTLLNGKTLSKRGAYGAFCAKVEEQVQDGNWFACTEEEYNADILACGQCGKFVIGTDYVRIPTITRFIGATITLSEVGKTYKESLPNITGKVGSGNADTGQYATGAFGTTTEMIFTPSGGQHKLYLTTFDASRSSSAYQDGAKVQPDHIKYPYYMLISTEGQAAEVQIDINKVYEDLNLKANRNLSNVSANIDYVVESYNDGTNWYRVYKSGWIEQGGILRNRTEEVKTFNLLKPFADTNYTGNAGICTASAMGNSYPATIYGISGFAPVSTSQACVRTINWSDSSWFACGQGA